jgi:hypothetical protein
MTDFININGLDIPIQENGAEEQEPDALGTIQRMFNGDLRSDISAEYRKWQFTTAPLDQVDEDVIRNMIRFGTVVVVSGDALGTDTLNCIVQIVSSVYKWVLGSHKRILTIKITQADSPLRPTIL